jgi:hypothetical protein
MLASCITVMAGDTCEEAIPERFCPEFNFKAHMALDKF